MKTKVFLNAIIPPYEDRNKIYFKTNAVRIRLNHIRTVDDRLAFTVVAAV